MYIFLQHRDDRLGAQTLSYISQILFALTNSIYIKYERVNLRFHQSIFIKVLLDIIDEHNKTLSKEDFTKRLDFTEQLKWNHHFLFGVSRSVFNLQSDLISRAKCDLSLQTRLLRYSGERGYTLPFDPSKTILVHLRLDDVSLLRDYDGRICADFYRNSIHRGMPTHDLGGKYALGYCNYQSPIPNDRMISICDRAQQDHPERKIVLLIAPHSKTTLPFETISNDSAEYDLFLLSQCDVIVLSRSTFSLMALCYGNHKDAYIPLWGHVPSLGLTTAYDHTNYKYFY